MAKFDLVQVWLSNVARSHSRSKYTRSSYARYMQRFCEYADVTPEQIDAEHEAKDEKVFRHQYTMILNAWQDELERQGYSPSTVGNHIIAIESFFKYSDLPLGFIPKVQRTVVFHNRDILKAEIQKILAVARPRERAFYAFMVQSGLRPETIALLQLEDMPELEEGKVPCLVQVPKSKTKGKYGAYFSFIGPDALKFLRAYLQTRGTLEPKDYLFADASGKGPYGTSQPSHAFTAAVRMLRTSGQLDFKTPDKKGSRRPPSELRLYNLRKYFRNVSGMGQDTTNFFMGHRIGGGQKGMASDDAYFSREDIEAKREVYRKGMANLALETSTPNELQQVTEKQTKEIEDLKLENLRLQRQLKELLSDEDREALALLHDPEVKRALLKLLETER